MRRLRFNGFLTVVILLAACLPVSADAPYMKKYHNKIVPEVLLTFYEKSGGGFRKTRTVNILATKPLSGYEYGGTRLQRFPAVSRNRSFVKIVYDVEKNLRAWVNLDDLSKPEPEGTPAPVFVTWFDQGKYQDYDCIDLFRLLREHPLRLYDGPCQTSRSRLVESYDEIGKDAMNPVVVEQRNGFVRLGFYDSCGGTIRKSGWWIRIRDDKGRLTIWPHICLSC